MKTASSNKASLLLYGLLGTLALLAVTIGYFYTHKPFSPEQLLGILITAWRMAVVFGVVSLGGAIGFRILKGTAGQPLSRLAVQAALGLGLLSAAILLLGGMLGFVPWLFASLLILGGFLLRNSLRGWWRAWAGWKTAWWQSDAFGKFTAVIGALLLACAFLIALAPPLQFDALTYHLAIPRAYLQTGRIQYLPENVFWGMPQETEMLYSLAMLFGGNEAAALLGWAIGALTLTGLYGYASERLGVRAGWAAIACLLAGETFSASLAWGYVEWTTMLYGLSMLAALTEWEARQKRADLLLAGVFAGMGLATKYSAGILLLAGAAAILRNVKAVGLRATWKALWDFGLAAALPMLPWLAKNILATSNPFYPLVLPAGAMDSIRLDFYQKNTAPPPWYETLILPWQAVVWGVEGKVGYSASIGPLLLGLSPLAMLGWSARPRSEQNALRLAASVTATGFLVWAAGSQFAGLLIQSRLYFAVFPAWAVLGGAGFAAFSEVKVPGLRFGPIAAALTALVLSFAAFEGGVRTQRLNPAEVLLGLRDAEQYKAAHLDGYTAAMQAIRALPQKTRVLMLWETRSLDCLPRCDPDEVIDRWYHDMRVHRNANGVLRAWRQEGYTHLLLWRAGAEYARQYETALTAEDWSHLDALLAMLPPPENLGGSYALYRLRAP